MGKKSTSGEPMVNHSTRVEHARFQDAFELLSDRRYKQVEQLLIEQQEGAQSSGLEVMEIILAAACQLCLTCRQFQTDRAQYQQGLKESKRRERESRVQIRAMLTLLSQLTSLDTQAVLKSAEKLPTILPEEAGPKGEDSDKQPNFIQKVKQLLGLETFPPGDEYTPEADSEIIPLASTDEENLFAEQDDLALAQSGQTLGIELIQDQTQVEIPEHRISAEPPLPDKDDEETKIDDKTINEDEQDDIPAADPFKHIVPSEQPQILPEDDGPDEKLSLQFSTEPYGEPLLLLPPPQKTIPPAAKQYLLSPGVRETKLAEQPVKEVVPDPSLESVLTRADPVEDSDTKPVTLVVYCLGPFRVYQNNELITEWSGFTGQKILKYLVTQRGKPVPKEMLMTTMWAEVGQEAARRNLHQAIYSLRQTLRRREPNLQHILFENDCYLLNPAMGLWIDFLEFEKNAQNGLRLEAAGQYEEAFEAYGVAEGLYQGTYLEEDLYEEWTNSQRDYLLNLYLDITGRLSEYFWSRHNNVATIALCQKALGHDPCFEEAHRQLMQCYLAQGQRHLAMRQYQTCVQIMKEELGLNPSAETEALLQRITS